MTNTKLNVECSSPNPKVNLISTTSQLVKSSLKQSLDTNHRWFSPSVLKGNLYSEEFSFQILRRIYGRKKYVLNFKCFQNNVYDCGIVSEGPEWCSPVYSCKFGQSEATKSLLCLALENGLICLQQTKGVDEGKYIIEKEAHSNAVFDFCWVPNQNSLLTAVADTTLTLWSVRNNDLVSLQSYEGHSKAVKCVDVNPWDTNIFASGGRDCNIIIWDTRCARTCKANEIIGAHSSQKSVNSPGLNRSWVQNSIISVLFNQEYNVLSAGASDGSIKIWDLRKTYCQLKREPQSLHTLQYPGTSSYRGYTCMNISPHKERVYISCLDGKIYAYHLTNPTPYPVAVYYGHRPNTYYTKTCLSPCGSYLLSGSSDDQAYIWLTDSPGCPVAALTGHCDEVTSVAWNEDLLVTCCDDMRHRMFKYRVVDDTETWRTLHGFAVPYQKCLSDKYPALKNIRTQFDTGKCVTHNSHVINTAEESASMSESSNNSTKVSEELLHSDVTSRVMLTPSQTRLKSKSQVTPRSSDSKTLLSWLSSSKKTPKLDQSPVTPRSIDISKRKRKLTDLMESNQENIKNEDKKPALSPSKNVLNERENQLNPSVVAKALKYEDVAESALPNKPDSDTGGFKLIDEPNKIIPQFSLYHTKTPQSPKVIENEITPVKTSSPFTALYKSPSTFNNYTSPTANLPNYVIDGRSPHNRMCSPPIQKRRTTDWLTTLRRKKNLFTNGKQGLQESKTKKTKEILPKGQNKLFFN